MLALRLILSTPIDCEIDVSGLDGLEQQSASRTRHNAEDREERQDFSLPVLHYYHDGELVLHKLQFYEIVSEYYVAATATEAPLPLHLSL